jgi:hypothetical protein
MELFKAGADQRHSTKTLTNAGITISTKPVRWNTWHLICDNLDPDSNVIDQSELQQEKHFSSKMSTDAGIMISIKPAPKNASISISDNLDPDSN